MSTDTNFWTNTPTRDPKRGFRFRLQIDGLGGEGNAIWYAKKADKPTISFGEASHSYLNHTYYWPGRAEWNEVSVTLVDPIQPALAGNMAALVAAAGYRIPINGTTPEQYKTMSKSSTITPLGVVQIDQIDEDGVAIETWILNNAWVKELTWGELDYSNDDLTECTVKFRYDWASLTAADDGFVSAEGTESPFFRGPGRS